MLPDKPYRPPGAKLPIEIYKELPEYAKKFNDELRDFEDNRFESQENENRIQRQIIMESQVKEQDRRRSGRTFLLSALVIFLVCIFLTSVIPLWICIVGGLVLLSLAGVVCVGL